MTSQNGEDTCQQRFLVLEVTGSIIVKNGKEGGGEGSRRREKGRGGREGGGGRGAQAKPGNQLV